MRLLIGIGGCLIAVLAMSLAWGAWPQGRGDVPSQGALRPLEVTLGRPFVLYVDGDIPAGVRQSLTALDASVGAFAAGAQARTLMDVDVYVMMRDTWATYRGIENHGLAALIRENAQAKGPGDGVAWFQATLTPPDGGGHGLLVLLSAREGLGPVSDFCFALAIFEIARFSGNGAAFHEATQGPGSQWRRCHAAGWRNIADMTGSAGG